MSRYRGASFDHDQVATVAGQYLRAVVGNEYVVDDANSETFIPEENGWLDRHDHVGFQRVGAVTEHVDWLGPGRWGAGSEAVSSQVDACGIEPGVGDHLFRSFMRDDSRYAGADFGNTSVGGSTDKIVQLAHPRRRFAKAELSSDRGGVAFVGCSVFNIAEVAAT